jgi:uncharacterized protein YjbI with pentapeptide repeats
MARPNDYDRTMVNDEKVWTPEEIRRRYENGERDFRGLDISDPDTSSQARSFRGAILDDADFTDCFIVADFTSASLRNCKFRANVKTCSFDLADLRGADFTDAAIDAATFRSARLHGANFAGACEQGYEYKSGELPKDD